MLNLTIAMLANIASRFHLPITPKNLVQPGFSAPSVLLVLLTLLLLLPGIQTGKASGLALQIDPVGIDAPHTGEVLQGVVAINGYTEQPGFRSMEVDFAYASDPTHTWFLIQQGATSTKEGPLASWDTTTITDGNYRLRLQVFLQDGRVLESVVDNLYVRNYTQVEASLVEEHASGQRTPTPTVTPLPDFQVLVKEPTPLPTNPAQLTPQHLQESAMQGVLVVGGLLAAGGLYLGIRLIARR